MDKLMKSEYSAGQMELVRQFGDGPENKEEEKLDRGRWVWRNYDLFAILANVRNGFGFGGCDTGDRFPTIVPRRGLPADVSDQVADESERWGADGHSHTWMTLKEFLDFPFWDDLRVNRGYITRDEYRKWDHKSPPPGGWSGAVIGPNVRMVTEREWKLICEGDASEVGVEYHVQVSWKTKFRDECKSFWEKVVPQLQAVDPDPSKVRMVMWFDN